MEGETAQYAEYNPQSNISSETEIDKRLGGTLIAVGLGVAAAGFAGRYAFQLWKRLGQVLSQAKKMPTSGDLLIWPRRSTRPRTCWIKANRADNYSPHHPTDLLDYSTLPIKTIDLAADLDYSTLQIKTIDLAVDLDYSTLQIKTKDPNYRPSC
uniref:Uncharacterized protein n=1 Tax=Oncorhynchus kisutch TaxID=8019 RepID=A0A8C7GST7_ONCKI